MRIFFTSFCLNRFKFRIFLILLFIPVPGHAQEFVETITEWFEFELGEHKQGPAYQYPTKLVLAPVISFEPSTSLGVGVGTKLLFKFNKADSVIRTSNVPMSAQYTLRNQFFFSSEYTIFTNREDYLVKGQVSYYDYPISFFGTGSQTTSEDEVALRYKRFVWEPILLRNVWKDLFIGGGIRYNDFNQVRLIENREGEEVNTSLQDSLGYTSSGTEFALTYDSRNNLLNASDGYLIEFTHGFYRNWMGSSGNYSLSKMDLRKYWQLQHEDVLAMQIFTRLSSEETPVLEQSALGGSDLMRGFPEQRFIDQHAVFGQMEYRWQTFKRIGFVFFAGMGDVGNPIRDWQFANLKYSVGSGLRIKIVESEDLNIRLDYGIGFAEEIQTGFYLGIAEAF